MREKRLQKKSGPKYQQGGEVSSLPDPESRIKYMQTTNYVPKLGGDTSETGDPTYGAANPNPDPNDPLQVKLREEANNGNPIYVGDGTVGKLGKEYRTAFTGYEKQVGQMPLPEARMASISVVPEQRTITNDRPTPGPTPPPTKEGEPDSQIYKRYKTKSHTVDYLQNEPKKNSYTKQKSRGGKHHHKGGH